MTTKATPGRISAPQSMTELRDRVMEAFADLWNAYIEVPRAKELSNLAGKAIKSAAVQVEYAGMRGDKPEIPFLK